MEKGKFITLEGPEGSGKTSHITRLGKDLRLRGYRVLTTREPGGTRLGEYIRNALQHDAAQEVPCPESEVMLFSASRAQLVRQVIIPALNKGCWVLADRFADSTTAYQGYARGFDVATIEMINKFAIGEAIPDLTLLLDLPVELGLQRMNARNELKGYKADRIEQETLKFHENVRQGYLDTARKNPERFAIIDANQKQRVVYKDIYETLVKRLKL